MTHLTHEQKVAMRKFRRAVKPERGCDFPPVAKLPDVDTSDPPFHPPPDSD